MLKQHKKRVIFISKTTQKEIGEFIINKSCNRD